MTFVQLKSRYYASHPGWRLSDQAIFGEVGCNQKQRFEIASLNNSEYLIRCCQGHSDKRVKDEALFEGKLITYVDKPEVLLHGTSWNAIVSIFEIGLMPGGLLA